MLAQTVLSFDLILTQSAYARKRPAAVSDSDCDHDFIGTWCVIETDFHTVEMTADESGVFVAERDVEHHAQAAPLFGGGNQRSSFTQDPAYWSTELGMEDGGGVLDFPVFTDGGGFAIALGGGGRDRQRGNSPLSEKFT